MQDTHTMGPARFRPYKVFGRCAGAVFAADVLVPVFLIEPYLTYDGPA